MLITDDLPIRGFIGHLEEGSILPHNHKTYLWTHLHFSFEYNGDQVCVWRWPVQVDNSTHLYCCIFQVITANVSTLGISPLPLDDVIAPLKVTFTYSAKWSETKLVSLGHGRKEGVHHGKH